VKLPFLVVAVLAHAAAGGTAAPPPAIVNSDSVDVMRAVGSYLTRLEGRIRIEDRFACSGAEECLDLGRRRYAPHESATELLGAAAAAARAELVPAEIEWLRCTRDATNGWLWKCGMEGADHLLRIGVPEINGDSALVRVYQRSITDADPVGSTHHERGTSLFLEKKHGRWTVVDDRPFRLS
jgi:hypothetical protein